MGDERSVSFPPYPPTASHFVRHVAAEWDRRDLAVLDDRRLSFTDADRESGRLAEALLASGVTKGTRVGILAPNGPDWVIAFFAATRIGAVAVLLNTYWRPRELGWVLEHSEVEVLFTVDHHLGHDYVERLEEVAPGLAGAEHRGIDVESHPALHSVWMWGGRTPRWAGSVDELRSHGHGDLVDDVGLAEAEATVAPDDPMLVIYSSGSTSDPKGVVHSHRAAVCHPHNLLQFRDLEPGDVAYTPMPLFWVGGLSFTLLSCMHAGATAVFEERFDPPATLALIERERVTHVVGWPHMGKALVEDPTFGDRDLSSVRSGSIDALVPEDMKVGDPELRANSLGMTESLGPHSIEMIGSRLPDDKRGSFGRSVPGVEHRIVDPISGDDLPAGELGSIWIRGYSLMLGMLRRNDADVFEDDGWYDTGDGGFLDTDGHLFFKGRLGTVIKSAGMNITPREVELVIEEQPDVMHAFVAAVPHHERGEDVAAAVVARPGQEIDPDDLRARVKAEMASYKVPRHVAVFASPQDLPWLESGKIDLRALQQVLVDRFGSGTLSTSTLPEPG